MKNTNLQWTQSLIWTKYYDIAKALESKLKKQGGRTPQVMESNG